MKIKRHYEKLEQFLEPNKVLVMYGPRRVGKTTLLRDFLAETKLRYRFDIGDDLSVRAALGAQEQKIIKEYAEGKELIVIDEAQKIPNIGAGLKIMVDTIPGIRVIATGSSSFELLGQIGEPLTGRKRTLTLFPIAQMELAAQVGRYDVKQSLSDTLVFGGYPEIASGDLSRAQKEEALKEIVNSYLLKDIFELDRVRSPKGLMDLLRLVAYQVGSEVALSELGTQIAMDTKTVARYLDLMEKAFVLFNLRGYSRNMRSEVTKKSKYYFYDNGVRNAVVANFNPIENRNDVGALWENFLVMEREKVRAYTPIHANPYFWRTWDRQEVDLVEDREGKLFGYEFKWGNTKVKEPRDWCGTYAEASYEVITTENYLPFVGVPDLTPHTIKTRRPRVGVTKVRH